MLDAVATFALRATVCSGAVALLALTADALARRAAARLRHAVLLFALLVAAGIPLMPAGQAPGASARATTVSSAPQRGTSTNVAVRVADLSLPPAVRDAIAVAYLASLGIAGFRLARAGRVARRLRATAHKKPLAAAIADAERLWGATLGVHRAEIRFSPSVAVPLSIGSTIILPAGCEFDGATATVIVGHEMAHIRRRDYLVHCASEWLSLPLSFHPLIALLKRRLATTREMACDELVASTHVPPREYARILLRIAQKVSQPPSHALAFGEHSALEERIRALKDRRSRTAPLLALATVAAIAIGASFVARLPLRITANRHPNLSGRWTLNRALTDFGGVPAYQAFSHTLEDRGGVLRSSQRRTLNGKQQCVEWQVATDGLPRPIIVDGVGGQGVGRWEGDALVLEMTTTAGHWERSRVTLTADGRRLVCAGEARDRDHASRFRVVFDRSG